MHIRKFDFDFARRHFMAQTARGFGAAGVLSGLWPEICCSAETTRAYPEELLDIESFTKGRVKAGDVIDADTIDLVQDLVDPILFQEVKQDGRKFVIQRAEHQVEAMYPPYFFDATLNNQGQARFDNDGNITNGDGRPWIGGLPFPDAQTGADVIANLTLSWGRHDRAVYAIPSLVFGADGDREYEYDFVWAEQQCTGLVHPDAGGPYLAGYEDKTRLQSVWFTHTQDVKGSCFLSIWDYDQRKFPDLFGYLPQFKRVRRFPSNQRFEPYMPGMNLYLSDAWAAGDPMLTWGNFKIIHRGPFLGSSSKQWQVENNNWEPSTVGGGQGHTYYYVAKELIPEVIVFEGEPTGYPHAPVSKRRIYVDARNMTPVQAVSYDRRGEAWKGFEGGGGQRIAGDKKILTRDGRPDWSWDWAISHDVQSNKVTRFHQAEQCRGNWKTQLDPEGDMVNQYMTNAAMLRMGT